MPPIAILVALADPTRCRIIEILKAGPQPVHQIAAAFDISRPAISRHLGVLKQARLISETKSGRENRYQLHAKRLKPVQDWLVGVTAVTAIAPAVPVVAKPARKRAVPAKPAPAVAAVIELPATPVPRRQPAPTSQMGFDF